MKKALLILTALSAAVLLSTSALAETRGKSLKRAVSEIRKANFTEAEKIYRGLLEKDQTDKEARLGLSFALIKQI
jgi:Flp pilus assembly protein TadD